METLKALFLVTALAGVAHGQGVLLNAGDTWTYQFTNLDYVSTQSGSSPFGATFSFTYSISTQPATLTYDCFEGFTTNQLLGSGTQPIGTMGILLPTNAWQDLQGSVRITVTDGSFSIDSLTFTVWRPSPSEPTSYDTYSTTVTLAPEPGPGALIAGGLFLLSLFARSGLTSR